MKGSMVLCGVGGMGILKASEVIAEMLIAQGLFVRQSEVHGMAQRGGTVITHLRFGEEAYSPLLMRGEAEYMIAFESMEALRYTPYLKLGATVVVNSFCLHPPGVNSHRYPTNIPETLQQAGFQVTVIPATEKSLKLGDVRVANMVLLGAFSRIFPIGNKEDWENAIHKTFSGEVLELNLSAFREGRA